MSELKEKSKEDIEKAAKYEADKKKKAKIDKEKKAKKLEEDRKSGKIEKEMEKQIDPELNIYLKNDKNTEDMLGTLLKGMGM